MAPKVQPQIVLRETVKPSSSTLNNHPTIHNLSFFDRMAPPVYVPLLFFYSSRHGDHSENHKSNLLKVSLSAALSHYYPLAGRIKGGVTVDCNDDGVLFLEARMECDMSDILMNNDHDDILKPLFPDSLCCKDSTQTGPVAVQVTYFKCGGMSIGLCLCHKIMDMESMCSFINDWASIARKSELEISPQFDLGSFYQFPTFKQINSDAPPEMKDCVSRRLVFDGSKIAKLKAMVADHIPSPTRIEVVTALLNKSAIFAAAKASSSGSLKPSVMSHMMNLRTHVSPPLTERNIGNLIGLFPVSVPDDRLDIDLVWLVEQFRQSKTQLSNSCGNTSNREELCPLILKSRKFLSEYFNGEQELYVCTSWCGNPFYDSDFGWGKPLWVATVCFKLKNTIYLIDTIEGDGIEAYISLEEKVMAVFEHDEELLSFSVVNPSILDFNP